MKNICSLRPWRSLNVIWLLALPGCQLFQERTPSSFSEDDVVPLATVVALANGAVIDYQNNSPKGDDPLPPLAQADFHFKAVTEHNVKGDVTLAVFKLAGAAKRHFTKDVTFTYAVPPPKKSGPFFAKQKPDFQGDLSKLIAGAARSVKDVSMGKLKFKQLKVEVEYGVDRDASAGISLTVTALATSSVNAMAGYSDSTVQSITLTFQNPEPVEPPKPTT